MVTSISKCGGLWSNGGKMAMGRGGDEVWATAGSARAGVFADDPTVEAVIASEIGTSACGERV